MRQCRAFDWKAVEEQQKAFLRNIKNVEKIAEFFANIPEAEFVRDERSGEMIKIKEAKDSTLRRITKNLNSISFGVKDEINRQIILDKLAEVNEEIDRRINEGETVK